MINSLLMKKLLFLGFFNLFFSVSTVFAGNPIAYFSLDSNILDPGAYSTPWGGCGPMDSNCYTVKKASSPSILQNKNDQNNNQSVLTLNSNNNSSIIQNIKSSLNSNTSISNSALLSALRNLFTVGLPDDLLSKLQGPVGPVGPKGDSGLNISGGYTPIPVNYAPMGTIPSSSNFSGGTVLSSTFLSAKEFTSGTVNITDIATIATLNISKDSNITGNLSVGGTTTLGDASDDTTTINSGSWTFANDTNFALTGGINGLSFDTDTLSIDSTNHRIGIGTTSPTQKLDVSGNININTNGTSILFSSYKGADSDGDNIFIGGGGLSSVGVVGETYKGAKNTALGASSLYSNTTGYDNTAIGYQSLYNNTTGTYNVAVGNQALYSNTVGYDNIAIGYKALYSNVSGHSGVAIGFESQLNVDPATRAWTNYNTSIGFQSLRGSTTAAENIGDNNTAIGYQSLYSNSSGHRNTAIGSQSLLNNTTGTDNSAIGNSALYSNTTGSSNSAIGNSALYSNTTGSNNTALGHYAGRYLTDGLTGRVTGNNGLYIGYATKASADGTDNEIVIGASAIGAGSNSVTLGNDSITKTLLKGNVGIGTTSPPALLSVGSGTHETATFSVTGENSGTIANFRDEDGENIFKTSGSVAAGNLSVLFGDMDYAGNGNYFSVGTSTPSTKLEVFSATTPQFKISYDASNNSTLDTDASGYFTLNPSGGITNIGSSTGIDDNELRIYGYTTDNKYLSLTHTGSDALIEVSSGTGWLRLGNESTDLTGGVMLFGNSTSGENREFRVYGYNTATSLSNYGGLKYDDTYDALVVKTDTGHIQIGDAGSTTLTTPTNDDLFISGRMQTLGESYLMG
ncbi:MAG: putative T4-like protein proximal tail fiber, partial [Candidatus Nomurabacteria bacterium GW2011_GWE2_31_40]